VGKARARGKANGGAAPRRSGAAAGAYGDGPVAGSCDRHRAGALAFLRRPLGVRLGNAAGPTHRAADFLTSSVAEFLRPTVGHDLIKRGPRGRWARLVRLRDAGLA